MRGLVVEETWLQNLFVIKIVRLLQIFFHFILGLEIASVVSFKS